MIMNISEYPLQTGYSEEKKKNLKQNLELMKQKKNP